MDDRYGNYYYRGGSGGLWRSFRDGDFEESEVWDVLSTDHQTRRNTSFSDVAAGEPSAVKQTPSSAAKPIPRPSAAADSGGSAPRSVFAAHQSAPVSIPNWTHVRRRIGRSKSSKLASGSSSMHDDGGGSGGDYDDDDEEDDEGEYGDRMLPPHEYIAMRVARSKISSFSVMEGAGRKLKGRDLSKVRNHVLTKTGFLESPPN